MNRSLRILMLAAMTAAMAGAIAEPSFADGKKGKHPYIAKPVPRLRIPPPAPPAPLPPPVLVPPPPKIETGLVLPPDFGSGGVGLGIDGGFVGGGRSVVYAGAGAGAAAVSFAYASASATSFAHSRGGSMSHGCGCGHH